MNASTPRVPLQNHIKLKLKSVEGTDVKETSPSSMKIVELTLLLDSWVSTRKNSVYEIKWNLFWIKFFLLVFDVATQDSCEVEASILKDSRDFNPLYTRFEALAFPLIAIKGRIKLPRARKFLWPLPEFLSETRWERQLFIIRQASRELSALEVFLWTFVAFAY